MTNEDICPVCESKITPGGQACDVCGADLKLLGDSSKAQYVCPECGNELLEEDTNCPKCGVQFAKNEQVVFQCPACNTEVDASANKCPNCGAEFLSDDEATATEEVPKAIESVPSVSTQDASYFDDMASGISTGSPEKLINEFEKTLKGIDSPSAVAAPSSEKARIQAVSPSTGQAQKDTTALQQKYAEKDSEGDKHGRFHFKFGKKRDEEIESPVRTSSSLPPPPVSFRQTVKSGSRSTSSIPAAGNAAASPARNEDNRPVIEQLRALLKFAGDASVDISEGKKYLDISVEFAKSGDSAEALRNIRLAYMSIESNIQAFFKDKMGIMRKQIEIENVAGERRMTYESRLSTISEMVRSSSYEKALESVQQFQSELSPKASQFGEAKELVDRLEELLRYADEIGIDYNSSRMIFTEARKHLATGDWSSALVLARQSRDSLMRSIPPKLLSEMNKARSEIIDAKIGGMKVTDFITTLKEASNAYNDGKYDESLRFMNIFRREFDRARSLSTGPRPS